jgi:ABC-type dipeptide/oligopeptide/nickel transport system permease subunit
MSATFNATTAPNALKKLPGGRSRVAIRQLTGRQAVRVVLGTTAGRIGIGCAVVVAAVIIVGATLHNGANTVDITSAFRPPSWAHPFGTDQYGRDELARVSAAGRTSLLIAGLVTVIATVVALVLGIAAGFLGGIVDSAIMRLIDVLLSIPSLVLAMAVIGALGSGYSHLVEALAVGYIASFTRMTRAYTLSCRHRGDLAAAQLAGTGRWRTAFGHVVPSVAAQLTVVSTLSFGDVVLSVAALSFLGLGVQPPTAEWGSMLANSRSAFELAPWLLAAPGLAIVLTALAVNLVAEALREGDVA